MSRQPTRIVEVTAVVQAGAYVANDAFGARLDFTAALLESMNGAVLESVVITALNTNTPAIDVIFFDDEFQAGGNNDPSSFTDADLAGKCIGHVGLLATDWSVFANNAVASRHGLGMALEVKNASGTLYAQMVTRSNITPGSASDYTVKLGLLKD